MSGPPVPVLGLKKAAGTLDDDSLMAAIDEAVARLRRKQKAKDSA